MAFLFSYPQTVNNEIVAWVAGKADCGPREHDMVIYFQVYTSHGEKNRWTRLEGDLFWSVKAWLQKNHRDEIEMDVAEARDAVVERMRQAARAAE